MHTCHSTQVEVRGQLALESVSSSCHVGPGAGTQVGMLSSGVLYSAGSHLSPTIHSNVIV